MQAGGRAACVSSVKVQESKQLESAEQLACSCAGSQRRHGRGRGPRSDFSADILHPFASSESYSNKFHSSLIFYIWINVIQDKNREGKRGAKSEREKMTRWHRAGTSSVLYEVCLLRPQCWRASGE